MHGLLEKHFHKSWIERIPYLKSRNFLNVLGRVGKLYTNKALIPDISKVFRPYRELEFKDVEVVIISSSPYNLPGQPTGLALGTEDLEYNIRSQNVIFDEIERDFGRRPEDTSLMEWVNQGVLLINASPTVEAYSKSNHLAIWYEFTRAVIYALASQGLVFLFIGEQPQQFVKFTDCMLDNILTVKDPDDDPYKKDGLFGSSIFSQIDQLTIKNNGWKIEW